MRRHTDKKIELKILEHPSEMWYKDVGGKRSHLTCVMELVGKIPKGLEYDLKADLYYESSKRLAEEWQWILHFLVVDNRKVPLPVLSAKNPRAEVQFRIEKVSTSFMNQRFKVHFVATPRSQSDRKLEVFTTPIESKAKPKRTSKKRTLKKATTSGKHTKRRRMDDGDYDRLDNATRNLIDTQEKLERTENMLQTVVCQLENCIRRLDRLENKKGGGLDDDAGTSDSEDVWNFSNPSTGDVTMPISTRLRSASGRGVIHSNTAARDLSLKRMTSSNRYTSNDWFDMLENDSEMRAQRLIPGM